MNKETPTSADALSGNSDDVGKTDNRGDTHSTAIQPQADNSGKGQPAVKPTNKGSDKEEDSKSSSDVSSGKTAAAATKESAPAAGVLHSAAAHHLIFASLSNCFSAVSGYWSVLG